VNNSKPETKSIQHGDVIVTKGWGDTRHRVLIVDSNVDGLVFVCVNLETGADSVVLEREIVRVNPRVNPS